jgi:hypothetical protein
VFGKAAELAMTLLLVVSMTGCMATFASRDPEQHFDLRGRPSLYVSVTSEMLQLNNADQSVPLLFDPDYSDDVLSALRACDCFAAIDTTPGPHDLEADIRVSRVVHNKSALLNLATAMVIPAVEDRRISIQVSIRDPSSNAEAKAERVRDFRVWYQLFLLPIYPFKSPAAFEVKLLPQLVREAVAEATARISAPAAQY